MMELPPKSILSNTTAIVSACEWAEVSPDLSDPSGKKSQPLQFVLVTELAALLHLGSYTHARHLWHRHRQNVTSALTSISADQSGVAIDPELDQFHRLWKAAQPLLLASASPSLSSYNTNPNSTSSSSSSDSTLQIQTACRRFYTHLQSSCIQTAQQPLATYAEELYRSQRMQMAHLLEETFDSIPRSSANTTSMDQTTTDTSSTHTTGCRMKDLLGFDNTIELEEFLSSRGWQLENEFWIPGEAYLDDRTTRENGSLSKFVMSNGDDSSSSEEQKGTTGRQQPLGFGLLDVVIDPDSSNKAATGPTDPSSSSSWRDEKIHFLTHIVGFMEKHNGMDLMAASREGAGAGGK